MRNELNVASILDPLVTIIDCHYFHFLILPDTGYYPQYLYLDQTPKEWEPILKRAKLRNTIGTDSNKSDDLVYLDLLTMSIWNWW